MSSAQPASAASAAAEASAGDPRFAQLLLGAYQWLETNGWRTWTIWRRTPARAASSRLTSIDIALLEPHARDENEQRAAIAQSHSATP